MSTAVSPPRLVVVDPGHFHAALLQQEMHPQLAPQVQVLAPLGPDLLDYLSRISRFNNRSDNPTNWEMTVHAAPDFLDRLRSARPGDIAVFSGRNHDKLAGMRVAVEAGLHVIADKPIVIERNDLPGLEEVLNRAAQRGLVVAQIGGGRDGVTNVLRALREDLEVFGEPISGTPDAPGVTIVSVHHLMKEVAGSPNLRPPWYFDVTQQGEGLADTTTHLVDRTHAALFPDQAIDYRRDIDIVAAERWPTAINAAQFAQVTGEQPWPDYLTSALRGGVLDFFCNGRVRYRVRGINVMLEVRWDWQPPAGGGDTHEAVYRGSRARLELRQGRAENYRPELYITPNAEIAAALERRVAALQPCYPGVALERRDREWRVAIPDALRLSHDAQFAAFTRRFLGHAADPASQPPWETPNLLAKYFICTEAVALSRG